MITLSNDRFTVTISEKGAELSSVRFNGLEYLWQADPAFWGKHSPILFPIVGELKNGAYLFEGQEYKMSRHGFARDKIFKVSESSPASVTFKIQSDESTLAVYPFPFSLDIRYSLEANMLSCHFLVKNTGANRLYFSLGGHPAFNVPLEKGLAYPDYFLTFEEDTELEKYPLEDGLIAGTTQKIALKQHTLTLQPSLFYQDAIVLKSLNSKVVTLSTKKGIHGLSLAFEGFPYFGIWASKDAPFVCLEPWCGIADSVNRTLQLQDKEGINELPANETWEREWKLKVF